MSETRISASRFSARSAPTKSSTNSSAGAIRISAGVAYCATLPPSLHDRDPVAHLDRLVDVVGDEEDGLADLRLEAQELVLEALAVDRVDRPEGLVHQHHQRVGGERPGDADALLLAAGELRRVAVAELGVEADQRPAARSCGRGSAPCPSRAAAARWRCSRRSCGGGRGRSAGSRSRSPAAAWPASRSRHRLAADQDVALGHLDRAVDHPHRGRLAAARGADQDADLAGRYLEGRGGRPRAVRSCRSAWWRPRS